MDGRLTRASPFLSLAPHRTAPSHYKVGRTLSRLPTRAHCYRFTAPTCRHRCRAFCYTRHCCAHTTCTPHAHLRIASPASLKPSRAFCAAFRAFPLPRALFSPRRAATNAVAPAAARRCAHHTTASYQAAPVIWILVWMDTPLPSPTTRLAPRWHRRFRGPLSSHCVRPVLRTTAIDPRLPLRGHYLEVISFWCPLAAPSISTRRW